MDQANYPLVNQNVTEFETTRKHVSSALVHNLNYSCSEIFKPQTNEFN